MESCTKKQKESMKQERGKNRMLERDRRKKEEIEKRRRDAAIKSTE